MRLQETEGSLYEYLEGILLKGVGRSGIYDIREVETQVEKPYEEPQRIYTEADIGGPHERGIESEPSEEDWVDVEDGMEIIEEIRRTKKFAFNVSEFAVDPGQDLLILVEVK
jgi:hypothetical protein